MRKIIIISLFLCWGELCFGQFRPAKVDERFELTSIACRLAGAKEYSECRISKYAEKIDTVSIRFSQPMLGSDGLTALDEEGVDFLPYKGMPYWKDDRAYVILIDKDQLEKGKEYGVKLPKKPFISEKYYSMEKDFNYKIHIGE